MPRTRSTSLDRSFPLAIAGTVACLLCAGPVHSAGLTIDLTLDGVTSGISPPGAPIPGGGAHYLADLFLPAVDASFDVIVRSVDAPLLSGTATLSSNASTAVTVDLILSHDIDTPLWHTIRRSSTAGLVPFGGGVSSLPGTPILELLVDGVPLPSLLPPGYSSSGTIGPVEELNKTADIGPAAFETMTQRWRLVLSPGATVIVNAILRLDTFDLNHDGSVDGGDIGVLLSNWGQAGVGDFNLDGAVDSADLGLLLAAW